MPKDIGRIIRDYAKWSSIAFISMSSVRIAKEGGQETAR
jgi:hypothetical protein